jgi:Undecaprenyl-phosphate galactose phosphotransferase WbaP
MSTGYRGETGLDLDALEELFQGSPPTQTTVAPPRARHRVAEEPDDLLAEGSGRSVPDSVAFATVCGRAARTLAPILLADVLALTLAGVVAQFLFSRIYPTPAAHVGWIAALGLLPLVLAYALSDLYSQIWVHPVVELRHLTHVNAVALIAAAVGAVLAFPAPIWMALALPAVIVLVPFFRNIARPWAAHFGWWGYPTLVIASGEGVRNVAEILLRVPRSGLRPVLLTDTCRTCRCSILPVVNDPAILESIVRSRSIRHAVVALPELSNQQLGDLLDKYRGIVPHLLVLSDCSTLPTLWGASRDFGRLSGIEVRNGLLLATLGVMKRAIDLSIAILVIGLGGPILLILALMMKLTSPGPIFYGHKRIGRHGKPFTAWKFRSMRINSEQILREHLERNPAARAEWNQTHKLRDDPRVVRFGAFLRRTSLDELPQIWNVLTGDMSLVGPRPIVTEEISRYADAFRLYASVKPGITGLWQVSGRNNIGYADRVLLDLFYIRHWSPWLDIYILAKTVQVLISRNGAY